MKSHSSKNIIRTIWETFSEDQKREFGKEKWSQRTGELFDTLVEKESHEVFVAENEDHTFLGYLWVVKAPIRRLELSMDTSMMCS